MHHHGFWNLNCGMTYLEVVVAPASELFSLAAAQSSLFGLHGGFVRPLSTVLTDTLSGKSCSVMGKQESLFTRLQPKCPMRISGGGKHPIDCIRPARTGGFGRVDGIPSSVARLHVPVGYTKQWF